MLWWTADLATGIDSIDQEHRAIFQKADEIFSFDSSTGALQVKEAFAFLLQYVKKHFEAEEKLMNQYQYPEAKAHHQHHQYLVAELHKITKNIAASGITAQLLDQLKLLIVEWLVSHINEEDQRMVSYIKKEGILI